MKKYRIITTKKVEADIQSNVKYIRRSLHNKTAAEKLIDDVDEAIISLGHLPHRYGLIDLGHRTNLGIRAMILRKYKIYYFIDEQKESVEILRMLHNLQDEFKELMTDENIYPRYINEDDEPYENSKGGFGGTVIKNTADLRTNYNLISELLNIENKHVIITKNGKKEAVLVSMNEFDRLNAYFVK